MTEKRQTKCPGGREVKGGKKHTLTTLAPGVDRSSRGAGGRSLSPDPTQRKMDSLKGREGGCVVPVTGALDPTPHDTGVVHPLAGVLGKFGGEAWDEVQAEVRRNRETMSE